MRPEAERGAKPARLRLLWLALAVTLAAGAAAAAATATGPAGHSEVLFLVQIVLLVFTGRLLGEVMQRLGQPAVMGQLIGGILLGPSVLGALWPQAQQTLFPTSPEQKSMIDAVSQIGILLLLLLAGMETDLGLVKKVRRAALSVSMTGIAVPFALGFALGEFLPDAMLPRPEERLVTALFLGTALSISSVKIVAMVVREMNFMRRNVGQVILASAIIDDTIGWIIIAITFSLAASGRVDLASVGKSVAGTALFLVVSFTIGRRLVFALIRWTNDYFVSELPVISAIIVIMGAMALTTQALGVHTVLGAFVAGILVGESPILTRQIDEQLRGLTTALFMPVFFGLAGLGADLTILADPRLLLIALGLILIASLGKFAGAFAGAELGGLSRREALALACGMNARGSTEVIVATIGLSMGVLSHDLFTMIVAMAVVTTLAMPPTLRWALARLPLGDDERERLAREEFEEKGFVPKLERLLVAVDETRKGVFAARLAGLLAGRRGLPVTLFRMGEAAEATAANGEPAATEMALKTAAIAEPPAAGEESDVPVPDEVHLTTRLQNAPTEEVIAEEARKGFDLLFIGVEPTVASEGGFHDEVARLARAFAGPLAVVSARGAHLDDPSGGTLSILVPITGAEASRRGAEVGFALAQAAGSPVTALYILSAADRRARRRLTAPSRDQQAVLKDIAKAAEGYGVAVKTAVRVDTAPEAAILRQARLGRHNLIVMGVSRRPGDRLSFGHVAEAVLESSERSLLFVSTGV